MCTQNECHLSVADPGFLVGGGAPTRSGALTSDVYTFGKNVCKMKEMDPVGGGTRRRHPPGFTNAYGSSSLNVAVFNAMHMWLQQPELVLHVLLQKRLTMISDTVGHLASSLHPIQWHCMCTSSAGIAVSANKH